MQKIKISLRDILTEGNFLGLSIGSGRDDVLSLLGKPKQTGSDNRIYRYGYIEFHFKNDKLFLIFSDYLKELETDNFFSADMWFLSDNMLLEDAKNCLEKDNINFRLENISCNVTHIYINKNILHFYDKGENGEYLLDAFSIT